MWNLHVEAEERTQDLHKAWVTLRADPRAMQEMLGGCGT